MIKIMFGLSGTSVTIARYISIPGGIEDANKLVLN